MNRKPLIKPDVFLNIILQISFFFAEPETLNIKDQRPFSDVFEKNV